MKNKVKPQTLDQINYVFSHPISFNSCATISYPFPPEGFGILQVDSTRRGKNPLKEITFSTFGEDNKRVMGVRTIDLESGLEKEDLIEFNKEKLLKKIFPKGRYQKENSLYRDTHHRKIK